MLFLAVNDLSDVFGVNWKTLVYIVCGGVILACVTALVTRPTIERGKPMFDTLRRIWRVWRVDYSLAKRLEENMKQHLLLAEENRRLVALVDRYEQGRFEKTEVGTINWKMEVDRLNRHHNELCARLVYAGQGLAEIDKKLMDGDDPLRVAFYARTRLGELKAGAAIYFA